jgi:hypothetical protein
MRRSSFIFIILLCCFVHSYAQSVGCPRLPDKYEWKTARENKRDEDLVLRTLQWLIATPMNEQLVARSKANLFVMKWICGSPSLNIVIETSNLPFYEEFPDLLFPYIHGVAQCNLTKNKSCDELKATINGFNTVAFMIQNDDSLKKNKSLQGLVKASKKGKMELYVQSLRNKKTDR